MVITIITVCLYKPQTHMYIAKGFRWCENAENLRGLI